MPLTSPNLIDQLLADQQSLSAAERFSQIHAREEQLAQEKYYRDLIPLSRPGPGEQYAFEVNLDACTGCKACVVACHSLNGLDEKDETTLPNTSNRFLPQLRANSAAFQKANSTDSLKRFIRGSKTANFITPTTKPSSSLSPHARTQSRSMTTSHFSYSRAEAPPRSKA